LHRYQAAFLACAAVRVIPIAMALFANDRRAVEAMLSSVVESFSGLTIVFSTASGVPG